LVVCAGVTSVSFSMVKNVMHKYRAKLYSK
jgi:hypothetical protein